MKKVAELDESVFTVTTADITEDQLQAAKKVLDQMIYNAENIKVENDKGRKVKTPKEVFDSSLINFFKNYITPSRMTTRILYRFLGLLTSDSNVR